MPPVPTVAPSFRSLPCWPRRRRLNTSSPAAASGRGCPRPPARATRRMTMAAAGVSLWSANAAMKSLFDTLNIVYGEEEERGFVKLNAISLLFTVGGILFVVAALGAVVVMPVALKYIGLSHPADLLLPL